MATLADAVAGGHLKEWELTDTETRLPLRSLYVASSMFHWVEEEPRLDDGSIKVAHRTPLDHLELLFNDLRCAMRPAASGFHRMIPTKHGIWKAHPPSLRVFGWCYAPYSFVAVSAALEIDLKAKQGLYKAHMQGVRDFISTCGLHSTVLRGDHRAIFPPVEG